VAHSFTYNGSVYKRRSSGAAKNINVRDVVQVSEEQQEQVQKGILFATFWRNRENIHHVHFALIFVFAPRPRTMSSPRVSTNHCHTLNASCTAAVATATATAPRTIAAAASIPTSAASAARQFALLSRCEKICQLATTSDASYRFLMAALGDLETQIIEMNKTEEGKREGNNGSSSNKRRSSPSTSPEGGAKRGCNNAGDQDDDDEDSNHENEYYNNAMEKTETQRQQRARRLDALIFWQ
jgi:hypothetical protein